MKPKILNRQSAIVFNQNEKSASPTVPIKGIITLLKEVIFLLTPITAPTTMITAMTEATTLKRLMSSSNFGNRTIIVAPMIAPTRDFRPPIMMANKNKIANSLL